MIPFNHFQNQSGLKNYGDFPNFPFFFLLSEGILPGTWIKTSPHCKHHVNKPFSGGQRALVQVIISLWLVPSCCCEVSLIETLYLHLVESIREETGWDQQMCCCPQTVSRIHPTQWLPVHAHRVAKIQIILELFPLLSRGRT